MDVGLEDCAGMWQGLSWELDKIIQTLDKNIDNDIMSRW